MLTLTIPIILTAFLAALGRATTPRAQRPRWTPQQLSRDVARGAGRFAELYDRGPVQGYLRDESARLASTPVTPARQEVGV